MCARRTVSVVVRVCVGVMLMVAVVPSVTLGVDLAPGGSVPVFGVAGGSGPGTVVHDSVVPFEIRGFRGVLLFSGQLQDRVVRSSATGTLSFERQIRDTVPSLNGAVAVLACTSYASYLTDVDFSATSLGNVAPDRVTRSGDGAIVSFRFEETPLFSGGRTRFMFASTEALDFTDGGLCTIRLVSGEEVVVPVVTPVRRVEPGCRAFDFEDMALGTTIPAGGAFTTNGVLLHVNEFFWDVGSCTNPTMGGFARVEDGGLACGFAHELMVNNVNIDIDYGVPLTDMVILFGEYGGNINLQVNGQCVSVPNFSDLPPVIGGVNVVVEEPNPGNGCGKIALNGPINSVSLGGQELWIDDVDCTPDLCADDNTAPIAELTDPPPLTCVCNPVEVFGTADDANFDQYRLEYRAVTNPVWTTISLGTAPVVSGLLGVWNTTGLAQGRYLIRLTVQDACGHSETAVSLVWLGTVFDNLTIREPDPGEVIGANACVDGTVWDSFCFRDYAVDYQPSGDKVWHPVDPSQPLYTSTVVNDPIAHWDTVGLGVPDGAYTLRVVASDDCGNMARKFIDVIVDNTPPIAVIDSPTPCSYVEGIVPVFGTALDANLSGWALQYTGGDESGWVTISSSASPVVSDLLGEWDTSTLRPCAYTLRLIVTDRATLNCNHTSHHRSEYAVSVNVGACGDFDTDDDGDVDLFDYHWFEQAFTGALP